MNPYKHSDFIYSILILDSMQFHLWDHLSLCNVLSFITIHTVFVGSDGHLKSVSKTSALGIFKRYL